jgi:hypothetical protein
MAKRQTPAARGSISRQGSPASSEDREHLRELVLDDHAVTPSEGRASPPAVPAGRVPRVARLLALTIRLEQLV